MYIYICVIHKYISYICTHTYLRTHKNINIYLAVDSAWQNRRFLELSAKRRESQDSQHTLLCYFETCRYQKSSKILLCSLRMMSRLDYPRIFR